MAFQMKNGKWKGQIRFTDSKGTVHRKTKNFSRKRDALQWQSAERKRLEEADKGTLSAPDSSKLTIQEWQTQYLEYAFQKWPQKTADEKKRAFERLLATGIIKPENQVSQVHKKLVLDVINKLKKQHSGCNVDRQVKNLKASWNWGIDFLDMPTANPFTRQPKAKTKKAVPHYMPPMQDLVSVLKLVTNLEHNLILYTTLLTAARNVELLRLTWDDIDFANNRIGLRTRKRKDGVEHIDNIPLAPELAKLLKEHKLRSGGHGETVFTAPQLKNGAKMRWLRKLCDEAGIKRFGLHGIRALAASTAHANGSSLVEVKELLRHQSTQQTDRYLRKVTEANKAVGILNSLASSLQQAGSFEEGKKVQKVG